MRPIQRLAAGAVVLAILGGLAWFAFAPKAENADVFSGYVEGEALYLAAPGGGTVAQLNIQRGDPVKAGQALFMVDPRLQTADRAGAEAALASARAQESAATAQIAQQTAALKAAEALAANARRDATRYSALLKSGSGAVSVQEVDRFETGAANAEAQRNAAAAALKALTDQAAAARASAARAGASLDQASTRLSQQSVVAPAAGRIEQTFFQQGEWAGPGQPIVSIIPDNKVKLRFYVPERSLSNYTTGREVRFSCDGCGGARGAKISYVSPRPEFTPPLIYSRKARERMMFLIEALPEAGPALSPGQPIDVVPLTAGGR